MKPIYTLLSQNILAPDYIVVYNSYDASKTTSRLAEEIIRKIRNEPYTLRINGVDTQIEYTIYSPYSPDRGTIIKYDIDNNLSESFPKKELEHRIILELNKALEKGPVQARYNFNLWQISYNEIQF